MRSTHYLSRRSVLAGLGTTAVAATLAAPRRDVTWVLYDNEEVVGERNGLGRALAAHPDWFGADLAVLGLKTGLTVLAGLGGDAVLARLDGLERLTVGTVDRWLAHEHCPQGVFGCTGMCRGLVRLPTRPRGSPRQNSPSP